LCRRTAELREANDALKDEIEERKRAERALRKSRERLTRIIDSAIDAIISIDPSLNIHLFNTAAEEIFRCPAAEAECGSFAAFLPDPFEALVRRYIEAHQAAQADDTAETPEAEGRYLSAPEGLQAQRADGTPFPVEATLCPIELPGQPRYLIILRDVNELKRAEAEVAQLESERSYLQEELKNEYNFDAIVGTSPPMQTVFDAIDRVAATETTVLVCGETGTGKELVARALHDRSARANQVLVRVNCAALSNDLIESELFGHRRHAVPGRGRRAAARDAGKAAARAAAPDV
jgi:PAS domain S-box-containing protein